MDICGFTSQADSLMVLAALIGIAGVAAIACSIICKEGRMNKLKSRFLVEDKRSDSGKDYRVSVGMTGNAIALAISVLVAIFDVPEGQAVAAVTGVMALFNMIRRWYSTGGEVKAKVEQ